MASKRTISRGREVFPPSSSRTGALRPQAVTRARSPSPSPQTLAPWIQDPLALQALGSTAALTKPISHLNREEVEEGTKTTRTQQRACPGLCFASLQEGQLGAAWSPHLGSEEFLAPPFCYFIFILPASGQGGRGSRKANEAVPAEEVLASSQRYEDSESLSAHTRTKGSRAADRLFPHRHSSLDEGKPQAHRSLGMRDTGAEAVGIMTSRAKPRAEGQAGLHALWLPKPSRGS